MAGIDHTIIAYKNGKLLKNPYSFDENDNYVSNIPFSYDRDGRIFGYDMKTYQSRKEGWFAKALKKLLDKVSPFCYDFAVDKVSYYVKESTEILLYENENFNVTIYMSGEDSYVLFGGYGHYVMPYTHFYHRGYGADFERTMASECYEYICEDVLKDMIDIIPILNEGGYFDKEEHQLKRIQGRLRFKSYWDMTKEEREADRNRDKRMAYYEDSII